MDFGGVYQDRRVLVTGLTGFKGTWLACWLKRIGASVCGISMDPPGYPDRPNHVSLLDLAESDRRCDIRHYEPLLNFVRKFSPEIVFHLAAQPLVSKSYREPIETFSTNIMGTAHLLQACRETESVRAVVVVTTDKVYENLESDAGYVETDRLGGHDPYAASKACCELLAESFRKSFLEKDGILLATARAGNVIGGGDWGMERLIPDLVRNAAVGQSTKIRMPEAIRPWQHVLEPLRGYLMLGRKLLDGDREFAGSWNFGPESEGQVSVATVTRMANRYWDKIKTEWHGEVRFHETVRLTLDCTKSRDRLGWKPAWNLDRSVRHTVEWYKEFYENRKVKTNEQLDLYRETCNSVR